MMKRIFIFAFMLMPVLSSAFTQESAIDDEESLFGSEEVDIFSDDTGLIEEITEENSTTGLDEAFLVSDGVMLNGSYSFSPGTMFTWSEDNLNFDNCLIRMKNAKDPCQ